MPAARPAETAIGVDVGGTRIRVGRVGARGELLSRDVESVRSDRQGFSDQILWMIEAVRRPQDRTVGVGIPGRVRADRETIVSAGYLDIAGLDLVGEIRRRTGLPACLENDATMALIAETRHRGDLSDKLVLMVTIGTGIGGAAVQDGRPWHGGGLAGQFGHIVVAADGPACNCGRVGCIETFSSGTALGRLIERAGLPDGTRADALLQMATRSDDIAVAVLDAWTRPMQRAIETLVSVADPALVVVGGGLGREMVRALSRLEERSPWFATPVEAARLADDAGVIGAGLHALDVATT